MITAKTWGWACQSTKGYSRSPAQFTGPTGEEWAIKAPEVGQTPPSKHGEEPLFSNSRSIERTNLPTSLTYQQNNVLPSGTSRPYGTPGAPQRVTRKDSLVQPTTVAAAPERTRWKSCDVKGPWRSPGRGDGPGFDIEAEGIADELSNDQLQIFICIDWLVDKNTWLVYVYIYIQLVIW